MSEPTPDFSFPGTVAVVTGAASGIGLAVARALAAESVSVVMADVAEDALRDQRVHLESQGHDVHDVVTDVADPDAVEALAAAAVERFGEVHIAVNNAGVVARGLCWELALEDWQRVVDVNLWGVIHGVRSFVPRILATGQRGHVVNTASMAALLAIDRLGAYTATKHGVLGLSDVLRLDLERVGAPVGVSVLMPGAVRTGMNPYGDVSSDAVATKLVEAIRRDRPYVYTDDQAHDLVDSRFGRLRAARADVIGDREEPG
jgi:NAD(P)-dependent dehydrogenase (short-subunit alcohol dehydrogenase family)